MTRDSDAQMDGQLSKPDRTYYGGFRCARNLRSCLLNWRSQPQGFPDRCAFRRPERFRIATDRTRKTIDSPPLHGWVGRVVCSRPENEFEPRRVFGARSLKCSFQRAELLGNLSGPAESLHGGFRERSDPSISAFELANTTIGNSRQTHASKARAVWHLPILWINLIWRFPSRLKP